MEAHQRSRQALLPVALGLLSLAGSLIAIAALHAWAIGAVDDLLGARLQATGESAAILFESVRPTSALLLRLMRANQLDAAYVIAPGLRVSVDSEGRADHPLDMIRVDSERLEAAFAGGASVGPGFDLAGLEVLSGYFPIAETSNIPPGGRGARLELRVLALEAGRAFQHARERLDRASAAVAAMSILAATALGLVALRWVRAEAISRVSAERAARGAAIGAMAAMAAHEIRNPLSVIRGTVELMGARSRMSLSEDDRSALEDVLGEVERLRRLTEDFLDLSTDRPMEQLRVDLSAILEESARALEAASLRLTVRRGIEGGLAVLGDAGRLRQVFANLLENAAQAQGEGTLELSARRDGGVAAIVVRDRGPGIPAEVRARLFDPFFTTRSDGTGLGLAIARRHVERHQGSIRLVDAPPPGTAFEVRLPILDPAPESQS